MAWVYVRGEELGRQTRAQRQQNRDTRQEGRQNMRQNRQDNRRANRAGAPAPVAAPNAPKLVQTKDNYSQIKIFPHGVATPAIAGAAANFNQVAQNAFLPIRGIMQASTSLNDVEASEIKVGNVSQLVVASTFPGQMFSPQADDVLCDLDVVPPGIQFIFQSISQTVAPGQRITLGWFGHFFSSIRLA